MDERRLPDEYFDGDRVRDGVPQCKALMDSDPNVTDL